MFEGIGGNMVELELSNSWDVVFVWGSIHIYSMFQVLFSAGLENNAYHLLLP